MGYYGEKPAWKEYMTGYELPEDDEEMDVEELAKWLFFGYRKYVIRGLLTPVKWENIQESAREDWRNFARVHKQMFHAGDKADT